jgi:hypothetical protein
MRNKTDEELYLLVHVHSGDYTPDALEAAREELSHREPDAETMNRIRVVAAEAQRARNGRQDGSLKGSGSKAEGKMPGLSWRDSDLKETATGWGCLILLCLLGYAIYGGYEWLNSAGWIPHDHDTPIWIQGEWMLGEYRKCQMQTTTPPTRVVLSSAVRAELPRLFCSENWDRDGLTAFMNALPSPSERIDALFRGGDWTEFDREFHVLPVHYQGRVDRADAMFILWRCQRKSDSLECKALN